MSRVLCKCWFVWFAQEPFVCFVSFYEKTEAPRCWETRTWLQLIVNESIYKGRKNKDSSWRLLVLPQRSRNTRLGGSPAAGSMVAWSVSVPEVLLKSFFVPCLPCLADTCLPQASSYPELFPARDTWALLCPLLCSSDSWTLLELLGLSDRFLSLVAGYTSWRGI